MISCFSWASGKISLAIVSSIEERRAFASITAFGKLDGNSSLPRATDLRIGGPLLLGFARDGHRGVLARPSFDKLL
jgi:hypothetical protein